VTAIEISSLGVFKNPKEFFKSKRYFTIFFATQVANTQCCAVYHPPPIIVVFLTIFQIWPQFRVKLANNFGDFSFGCPLVSAEDLSNSLGRKFYDLHSLFPSKAFNFINDLLKMFRLFFPRVIGFLNNKNLGRIFFTEAMKYRPDLRESVSGRIFRRKIFYEAR
jgi:hypothetical protein